MAEGGYDIDDTVTSNNIQEQLGTPPPSDSHGQGEVIRATIIAKFNRKLPTPQVYNFLFSV